jgi:dipeptidyl aminopeptidase/acylaminoacyl peptidase
MPQTFLTALEACLLWAQPAGWARALGPQLSPDGRSVAYEVQETDWAGDAFVTAVWLADAGGKQPPRRVAPSGGSPRWSPDGQRLAFLADHKGRPQVHVVNPRAGAARVLTSARSPVARLAWSPDGRRIAFTAPDPEAPERRGQRGRDAGVNTSDAPARMTHLWLVEAPEGDAAPGPPARLAGGPDLTVGEFAWSPDGRRIAFSGSREAASSGWAARTFTSSTSRRGGRAGSSGPDTNPVWSPDGRSLAYQSFAGKEEYSWRNHFVAVVPADGGEPRLLTDRRQRGAAVPRAAGPGGDRRARGVQGRRARRRPPWGAAGDGGAVPGLVRPVDLRGREAEAAVSPPGGAGP